MIYKGLIICLATALLLTHAAAMAPWAVGQEVTTSSGRVIGSSATRKGYQDVSQYVGIPYAHAPVGLLRFLAPKAYKSKDAINGTKWKDGCAQPTGARKSFDGASIDKNLIEYGMAMGGAYSFSEDCLGLNIWTTPQQGEKSKAVLLWIHGGGFSSGTPHADFMDGARYAKDEDVVFVSMHYRLNILGFPYAPGLPDQNLGLLDQRMAIEWVRDNIAAFGGDPKRITIFGESAGAAAVDYYAYNWPKDPIIAGIIAMSGSAGIRPNKQNQPLDPWFTVSKAVGCGGWEAGATTVECMRKLPSDKIMEALDGMALGPGITPFGPTPDGKVVFADYKGRNNAGNLARVPFMGGNTDHEAGLNAFFAKTSFGSRGKSGSGGSQQPKSPMLGGAVPPALANMLPKNFDPLNMMDLYMTCSSARAVQARRQNGIPAWRYRYMGVWENTALGPETGAYHSGEIPVVFGTTQLRQNARADSSEELKVVKDTMHAWATFAKNPAHGLSKLGWPVYDEQKSTLIRIGYNNQSALALAKSSEYDAVCNALDQASGN